MKTSSLFLTFILILSFKSIAQFNNNLNNRNNPNQQIPQNTQPSQQEIEKQKAAAFELFITTFASDLNLNELQAIAVRQIYTESFKKQGIIMKKDLSEEEKTNSMKTIADAAEKKVFDILDETQKVKFEELKNKKEKDYKKEKKRKKEK